MHAISLIFIAVIGLVMSVMGLFGLFSAFAFGRPIKRREYLLFGGAIALGVTIIFVGGMFVR